MQATKALPRHAVKQLVIDGRAFPAHAADEADFFHVNSKQEKLTLQAIWKISLPLIDKIDPFVISTAKATAPALIIGCPQLRCGKRTPLFSLEIYSNRWLCI